MRSALLFLAAIPLMGQTPSAPAPPSTAPTIALPNYVFGVGGTWNRGAAQTQRFSIDVTFSRLVGPKMYLWSALSTPVHRSIDGKPVPSTLLTGIGYVPGCSSTGSVCFVILAQGGAALPQSGGAEPAFTGSVGVAFHVGNFWVMPFAKALATATSTTVMTTATGTTTTTVNGLSSVVSLGVQILGTIK